MTWARMRWRSRGAIPCEPNNRDPLGSAAIISYDKFAHSPASPRRLFAAVWGRDRQHIPGGVRQPLLLPAPIVICPSLFPPQVVIDVVLVAKSAGYSVRDPARSIGEFPGIKEHVFRIVPPHAVHH